MGISDTYSWLCTTNLHHKCGGVLSGGRLCQCKHHVEGVIRDTVGGIK